MGRKRSESVSALAHIAADGIDIRQRIHKDGVDPQDARALNTLFEEIAQLINELELAESKKEIH